MSKNVPVEKNTIITACAVNLAILRGAVVRKICSKEKAQLEIIDVETQKMKDGVCNLKRVAKETIKLGGSDYVFDHIAFITPRLLIAKNKQGSCFKISLVKKKDGELSARIHNRNVPGYTMINFALDSTNPKYAFFLLSATKDHPKFAMGQRVLAAAYLCKETKFTLFPLQPWRDKCTNKKQKNVFDAIQSRKSVRMWCNKGRLCLMGTIYRGGRNQIKRQVPIIVQDFTYKSDNKN